MTQLSITDDIRNKVESAFDGFIGNTPAVYAIKRSLRVAWTHTPPKLDRVFLLVGGPSLGKTTLAKAIAGALGVPFLSLDGSAVKTREQLFDALEDLLLDKDLHARRVGERVIIASLGGIESIRVRDEIEPYLKRLEYIRLAKDGRVITPDGLDALNRIKARLAELPLFGA